MIIYLYYESSVPDEYILELEFESGGKTVEYKVPVVKLPEISAEEINRRHMVILIPFHLLKLRYWIKDKKMTKILRLWICCPTAKKNNRKCNYDGRDIEIKMNI